MALSQFDTHDPLLELIPGATDQRKKNLNRLSDLDKNIRNVRNEFIGLPEVCHQLVTHIIHLRRKPNSIEHTEAFYKLWTQYEEVLLEHLDVRWLLSVCDTLVDVGEPHQSAVAMNIVQCINRCNLDATILHIVVDGGIDTEKLKKANKFETWGGMITADIPSGDMLHNMMVRLDSVVKTDIICERIWKRIVELSRNENSIVMNHIARASRYAHQREFFK